MPHFLGGATAYVHQYKDLVPAGEHGFGGVLKTVLANPGYTATTILDQGEDPLPAADHGAARVLPVAAADRAAVLAARLLLHDAGARSYPWLTRLGFQYTAYWTSFLFLAVVANLRWLNRDRAPPRPRPAAAAEVRHSRRAWKVAMAAATLVTCYQLGPVFQQNTSLGRLPAVARRHQRRGPRCATTTSTR